MQNLPPTGVAVRRMPIQEVDARMIPIHSHEDNCTSIHKGRFKDDKGRRIPIYPQTHDKDEIGNGPRTGWRRTLVVRLEVEGRVL